MSLLRRLGSGGNLLVVVAGLVLAAYLVLVIGLVFVSQARLVEVLHQRARSELEKDAAAVSYFLSEQRDAVRQLATDRTIRNYLANRALGMSMEYGLRASLLQVTARLQRAKERKKVHGLPVFRRLVYYGPDATPLADEYTVEPVGLPQAPPLAAVTDPVELAFRRTPDGVRGFLAAAVVYKGRAAGQVVAEVDLEGALRGLLLHRSEDLAVAPLLRAPDQSVLFDPLPQRPARPEEDPVRAQVPGTGLVLESPFQPQQAGGYLTSPWLPLAIALLTPPLLFGIARLVRLNNHNLVLETRHRVSHQQRAILRRQNERLQEEIDRRRESEKKLTFQANYDGLTGLPNRHLAMDRLSQALKQAHRDGHGVLVMYLDLDLFKRVNDSLGHLAGDDLLRQAGARLTAVVRESDTVARLGGDEFLVVYPNLPPGAPWEHLAQALRDAVAEAFMVHDHEFFVGGSIGVARYPDHGSWPEELLKNADIAMYAAKEAGRNRYCLFEPGMYELAARRVVMERHLRRAADCGELTLFYQPIVTLEGGGVVAYEALMRWHCAELGEVPPDRFIPLAEETGIIYEMGEWLLQESCRAAAAWGRGARVAVNISARQFQRPDHLFQAVQRALAASGLPPPRLELEVTESLLLDAAPEVSTLMKELRRLGVSLCIDDFGTGFSSLSYLHRYPFDTLKIDRSFVRDADSDPAHGSLVRAILAMAEALGLAVVAEGIEREEQAAFLREAGCPLGQGYLFGAPAPGEAPPLPLPRASRLP